MILLRGEGKKLTTNRPHPFPIIDQLTTKIKIKPLEVVWQVWQSSSADPLWRQFFWLPKFRCCFLLLALVVA
jgi:hypothetical protein